MRTAGNGVVAKRGGLSAVAGVRAAGVACGLKKNGRTDLALVVADGPATVAATFTQNLVQAAPVLISKRHLRGRRFSALVLNSGNANACTGRQGLRDAEEMTREVARLLGRPVGEVFVASTGVIGRRLEMGAVRAGIGEAVRRLSATGGGKAAQAILTTDTGRREASVAFPIGKRLVTVAGMAKGSARTLQRALGRAVAQSFNCITVDGDTSTNDMVLCFATGAAGVPAIRSGTPALGALQAALDAVCLALAKMIARDGEGATKLAEVRIQGGRSAREARLAAEAVATSPLVKTTLFGQDINWGRIMAALGRSGARFDPTRVDLFVDEVPVVRRGESLGEEAEAAANRRLRRREFALIAGLHAGTASARMWTTDLSEEYVRINAGYRS